MWAPSLKKLVQAADLPAPAITICSPPSTPHRPGSAAPRRPTSARCASTSASDGDGGGRRVFEASGNATILESALSVRVSIGRGIAANIGHTERTPQQRLEQRRLQRQDQRPRSARREQPTGGGLLTAAATSPVGEKRWSTSDPERWGKAPAVTGPAAVHSLHVEETPRMQFAM